ncbi:beta-glucanase (GH16 family) [Thermoflavifilum aggregans]|uniref:Beta-glucanase (GH16 family) n=1 Tax=Thermoflavifilum aggregans TaxID=454188 RepID=A0A2M9CRK3_9BACT|nr:glycoside hydrolase family 16 protein [Thermoflavifilum aggregans]PJJ74458.1 beta-glucanase (GH16 family) [Thermoflavifilum aggregans]
MICFLLVLATIWMNSWVISPFTLPASRLIQADTFPHDAADTGWQLVWHDEFDYTGSPDSTKWNYEQGYLRNHEKQYYTSGRMENARVENGILIIEARNDSAMIDGAIRPITSASLITRGKASWTYGRIEVRAKLPRGRGTWPAIWMLGDDIDKVGWPTCGEIDIMEHVGFDPGKIHGSIHTGAYNWPQNTQKTAIIDVPDCMDAFHVYAIEWTPEKIDFYVDTIRYLTFVNEHKTFAEWPFDKPCYLILNIAIGGDWGGQHGIDPHIFPAQMAIDYVRVYQKKSDE